MVYFLGRDVSVLVGVERDGYSIANGNPVAAVEQDDGTATAGIDSDIMPRDVLDVRAGTGAVADVTGVDVTIGSVDEDVAYMGQRTALKAEIKKETTIVVTKKKKSGFFNSIFSQGIRYGVAASTTESDSANLGLTQPDANHGFRVLVAIKDTKEVMSIAGCTFSEYGTTVNADGVTEETLTFISHITPKIAATEETGAIGSVTEFVL